MKHLALGALAALLTATTAHATVIVTHWQGVLNAGSDPTDIFGTGNSDLAGLAYDLVVSVDTDKGIYTNYGFPAGDTLRTDTNGTNAPIGTATLTINGHSFVFGETSANGLGNLIRAYNNGGGRSVLTQTIFDYADGLYDYVDIRAIAYDGYDPASIFTPVPEGFCQVAGHCDGTFAIDVGNGLPAIATGEFGAAQNLAVPEPTTWALMVMGFGLAGVGLRRRRAVAA